MFAAFAKSIVNPSALKRILSMLIALAAMATVDYADAHALPLSADDLAQLSSDVVTARVQSAHSRWNDRHTLIVTDYTLTEIEYWRRSGDAFTTLTLPGGTVAGETHALCVGTTLQIGSRYLLFLEAMPNAALSPVVGEAQGAVLIDGDGKMRASVPLAQLVSTSTDRVDLTEVEHVVSALLGRIAYAPDAYRRTHMRTLAIELPAKLYDASRSAPPFCCLAPTLPEAQSLEAPPVATNTDKRSLSLDALDHGALSAQPKYRWERRPAPPVTLEAFPRTWSISPHDQYMMSQWNAFGDVFRVYAQDDGTWAWANGVYEMAGFPDNAQMQQQFGQPWGATTLAITFTRWFGNGPIVEADVAINPSYAWTLDDYVGTDPAQSAWGLHQTILHELGHVWGLQHPWETSNVFWDSVMNYSPKENRIASLRADDTAAIRNAYPGIAIHDAAMGFYSTQDDVGDSSPDYTPVFFGGSVRQGQSFSVSGALTIENTGSDNLVSPLVEFYLTARRGSWTGNRSLGTRTVNFTLVPHQAGTFSPSSFVVPGTTPPGRYVLAALLRTGDGYGNNDADWSRAGQFIEILNTPTAITLQSTYRTVSASVGPNGRFDFDLTVRPNYVYDFSLCASEGGAANFDTVVDLAIGFFILASSDDACGLASRVAGVAFTGANPTSATLRVRGYDADAMGNFTLAYRERPDVVMAAGFE